MLNNMQYFFNTKSGITLHNQIANMGKFLAVLGGILWINSVEGAVLLVSIGAALVALYYFINMFEKPKEQLDWTLVYPELASVQDDDKKKEEADN